jgi:hypothetical protein
MAKVWPPGVRSHGNVRDDHDRAVILSTSPPFYVDPTSELWLRPNLIAGLMKSPATERVHPLERQVTIALAWLLHHSPLFTTEVAKLFFAGDQEALDALGSARALGARAWGTLRPLPATGHLYPDVSIAGSERAFELLVEVKVDAAIHHWETDAGPLLQPDAYIDSWEANYDPDNEARVRRVGTLAKSGPGVALTEHPLRAADVTWKQVRELLSRMLEDGAIERSVAAVAIDFGAALDQFVLAAPEVPQTDDPNLAWGYVLLHELQPKLAACLSGGKPGNQPGIHKDYVTSYVSFEASGATYRLWVAVTPEGARYNIAGHAARLWLSEPDVPYPPQLAARFRDAGFTNMTSITPYTSLRIGIDVADIQAVGDESEQAAFALDWILGVLETTGVVDVSHKGEPA